MRYSISTAILLLAALLVLAAGAGYANTAPPSTEGWTLTQVVDGNGIQLLLGIDNAASLASYAGEVSKTWGDSSLTDPSKFIALGDSGAFLKYLTISLDGDPQVKVQFGVAAGATDQFFSITPVSGPVTFAALSNPKATATAAITVTDCEDNGAIVTGGFNGKFYRATYYDTALGWQNYCYLIDGPVTTDPYSSTTKRDPNGVPPWGTIIGSVERISAEFAFTLSANDSASGTSSFTVLAIPEPGSMVAMFTGIVGLVGFATRRKRSR